MRLAAIILLLTVSCGKLTSGEQERSAPGPGESVIKLLPIKSVDYESDRYNSESQAPSDRETLHGSWQHQPQLPVRLSQSGNNPPWSLQPQVGKRGKRYRAGGQSSYYRPESSQLNIFSESLDAVEQGAASTMLSRQQRNGRRYDVPQIGRKEAGAVS